jgi:hypothetical protein
VEENEGDKDAAKKQVAGDATGEVFKGGSDKSV